MELIHLTAKDRIAPPEKVIAGIGEFDGIHLGHRKLLETVLTWAAEEGAIPAVITFAPHPEYVLGQRAEEGYLLPEQAKLAAFAKLGFRRVYLLRFDQTLAHLPPSEFYARFLQGLAGLVAGSDWRYGFRGAGNVQTVAETGLPVRIIPLLELAGEKIGSRTIRNLLAAGDVAKARALLGESYTLTGTVTPGRKLGGAVFGFPTANVALDADYYLPRRGVYACYVELAGRQLKGVANLGVNPTVGALPEPRLEVHILDFTGDLYGKKLRIKLEAFLRPERKFAGQADLADQIAEDVRKGAELL